MLENDTEMRVITIFVAFALLVGSVCGIVELEGFQGLALAVLFFYVSYRVVPRYIGLEDPSFEATSWNVIKKGFIPYWFLWLVSWTLIFTLRF